MRFPTYRPVSILVCALVCCVGAPSLADRKPVVVGWQTPWATQGQLVMALEHSNISSQVDLELEFTGFPDGPRLNQAAVADRVDVLLTADQPAIALLNVRPQYRIVARMMYNRVCLYVPSDSSVGDLRDLRGKHVSGPVGAAAERVALEAMRNAGVDLGGVDFGLLDMAQQSALIQRGATNGRWGGVDALYGFDPLPAVWEKAHLARPLHCGAVLAVVVASHEMLTARRRELESFLAGFALAWNAYARHPKELNELYRTESGLRAGDDALDLAASVEPNRWTADVRKQRLTFEPSDIGRLGQAASFLADRGAIPHTFDVAQFVDPGPLRDAIRRYDLPKLAAMTQLRPDATR